MVRQYDQRGGAARAGNAGFARGMTLRWSDAYVAEYAAGTTATEAWSPLRHRQEQCDSVSDGEPVSGYDTHDLTRKKLLDWLT